MTRRLLIVEEVAERLRTTPEAIHQRVYKGSAPPSFRSGKRRLFPEDALEQWISDQLEVVS